MKLKNLLLCLMMGAMSLCAVSCGDDDVKENDVPEAVMTTFKQMFPNTTAKWEKESDGQLKAEFYVDWREMEVWFKKDGTWTMTQKDMNTNELPQSVLDYIAQNYQGLELDDADWVETPTEKYYRVELDGKSDIVLKFTEEGELIK
ncbi:MAG: PepSY-like domain-containing protein [Bacteroidaceae bacterium]|nr:PepSY-like domain-containing protein [Bacteroidaceae bacterium]MBR1788501.1 PepSY-like domain-containing protein [Bacteroidaceae bacterium]